MATAPANTEATGLPWVAIGFAAVGAVLLGDLSRLIGDVQIAGVPSYDTSVFTTPHFPPWNTDTLKDALQFWHGPDPDSSTSTTASVQRFIRWHILIDALIFALGYSLLLFKGLRRLGALGNVAAGLAGAAFVADEAENLLMLCIAKSYQAGDIYLCILHWFTLLKSTAIATAIIAAAWLWRSNQATLAQSGGVRRLVGPVALVIVFAAIIALPAGGPMEQLPDVVQYYLRDSQLQLFTSTLAVLVFATAVAGSGVLWLYSAAQPNLPAVSNKRVWVACLLVSLLFLVLESG